MIVSIVPGTGSASTIENGDIIESFSKIGASDILNTLSTTGENTAILTAKLLKVADALTDGKGTLGVLLNDTIMAKDLMLSVKNLKEASRGATATINELNSLIKSIQTNNETVLGMILNDTVSGQKLKAIVSNLEASSKEIDGVINSAHLVLTDLNSSQGALNYIVKDTSLVNNIKSTLKNINEGTDKFNENMEALKHNFLTRGYFRKLERKQKRESND
jgi:phospholipid/cholesterol/gamma-HCH transport system substrate-binding protein